ncbi:MAG: PH domain-containing protein [candidate division KSB1 bacterium]|nr:PH domain-containing protein [candidate division KSB1 bacterium]
MTFGAPWGRDVKWITWLVVAVLTVVAVVMVVVERQALEEKEAKIGAYAGVGGVLLVLLVVSAFAPRGYRVTAGYVEVLRPIGTVRIPLVEVTEVRRIEKKELSAMRLAGSGGFFGYYGAYRNRALGSFRMYVTDLSRAVLLRGKKSVVVSPDRPDVFVEVVRSYQSISTG